MDWLKKETKSIWSSLGSRPISFPPQTCYQALHLQVVLSSAITSSQKWHMLSIHYFWFPQVIHVLPIAI